MQTNSIMRRLGFSLVLTIALLPAANMVSTKSRNAFVDDVQDELTLSGPDDPAITPKQFLMISSPSEKKIVWTTLKNMASGEGRPYALVDSGLESPKGLAFDHNRGHLYVADSGAKKIFRYTILADMSHSHPKLTTSGVRLTITQGHPVDYVTIDDAGNLFYTAPDTNNINKISAAVMDKVARGEFKPSALQIVSEKVLEAMQATERELSAKKRANGTAETLPTDAPMVQAHIYSMYEEKANPHVSAPASIWADGNDLYWTNTRGGKTAGTVVRGQVNPTTNVSAEGPQPFPAKAITKVSEGAFSLSKSKKVMFFTRNGTRPNTGRVTGLLEGSGIVIDFVSSIQKPRGLVWDHDQTMYVADEGNGAVWSFPAGRMMANVPLTKTVSMKGASGLVLLSSKDPAFARNKVHPELNKFQAAAMSMDSRVNNVRGPSGSQASVSFLYTDAKSSATGPLRMFLLFMGIVALVA